MDEISGGRLDWKKVLSDFWHDFAAAIDGTKDLTRTVVIDAVDALLEPHLFPKREDGSNPRACPACANGRIGLKFGRFGSFIGCSNYPECRYTRPLGAAEPGEGEVLDGPKELGKDPETGLMVTLRQGPYGPYVQLGGEEVLPAPAPEPEPATEGKPKKKAAKKKGPKPKRASLPKGTSPADVDLEKGLKLLSLPREVGMHPEMGEMILAGIGRFGPYLKVGPTYYSLKEDDVLEVGLNRAVTVIAEGKKGPGRGGGSAKTLGDHPEDKKPVTVRSGRFGPYVQHGQLRATLPRDMDKDTVNLEDAIAILAAKAAKGPGKPKAKAKAKSKAKTKAKAKAKTKAKSKAKAKGKTKAAVSDEENSSDTSET